MRHFKHLVSIVLVFLMLINLALPSYAKATDGHSAGQPPKDASKVYAVSREYLHENAKDLKGQWVAVSGAITAINGDKKEGYTIDFEGASSIQLIMCDMVYGQDCSNLKEGDYLGIVGQVESKLLSQVLLYHCYIGATGDEAKKHDTENTALYADKLKPKTKLFGTSTIDKSTAIEVTAKSVWKEMNDNQVACKSKYDGKLVAVTGTIDDFGTNIIGQEYVTLNNGDKYSIGSVQCFFKNDQMDYVASLKKGDKVTLYGTAEVGSLSFKLAECQP